MPEVIASTYEIKEVIGAGGGGTVFLARHMRLNKDVVLKADKRKITTKEELLRREVNVLKDLHHAHIPQVYDFFAENDTVYTVIDYVQGESLDKPLKRGEKFSQAQVIKWGRQLLDALSYLHSPTHGDPPRGYVHSDIKPANLMKMPDGDICLIDFNIALAIGEESVVGLSAGYASPEHYGLDYSSVGEEYTMADETVSRIDTDVAETIGESTESAAAGSTAVTEYDDAALDSQAESDVSTVYDQEQTTVYDEEQTVGYDQEQAVVTEIDEGLPDGDAYVRMGPIQIGTASGSDASSSRRRKVVPDVRSDVYSVGATLYHLLSGTRPAKDAKKVIPLSPKQYSPLVVEIITKAMNPNPDLRYQTAAEMLEALNSLRDRDPRVLRLKRTSRCVWTVVALLFAAGLFSAFVGLKRIQVSESQLKLVGYSRDALDAGNMSLAVDYALQAIPEKAGLLTPGATADAQYALADAVGVYDLSDGYKSYDTLQLPSQLLCLALAPDGSSAACICSGELVIFDIARCEQIASLPAVGSALAEVEYRTNDELLFAGRDGVTAYSISRQETLWTGEPATGISISADGSRAAAVYRDESCARVYDADNGQLLETVDFSEAQQHVVANDVAMNPEDDLFALNGDGTLLAASFAGGGLRVFDLSDADGDLILFEDSAFTHFEGGFFDRYLAFSATGGEQSVFAVIDVPAAEQTGGFSSSMPFHVQADESGVYVSTENILVKIDPVSGEQQEVAYTETDIEHFCKNGEHTIVATSDGAFSFYGVKAALLEKYTDAVRDDHVALAGAYAVVGSVDSPAVRLLRLEDHFDAQVFSYDPEYDHDEARISADGQTVMLFRYDKFRLYGIDGSILADVEIPDAAQVYDQQFRRDGEDSWLEVTYNDGLVRNYSAADGSVLSETQGEPHDGTLYVEYETDDLRVEAPLHGAPTAYDRESGKQVAVLESEDYLTYVTQAGGYVITEYMTAQGERYGLLLNEKCETLARMPELCDILDDGTLVFDDMMGDLRQSRIYTIEELIERANDQGGS